MPTTHARPAPRRGSAGRHRLAALGAVSALATTLVAVTAPTASAAAPGILISKPTPAWSVWYDRPTAMTITAFAAPLSRTTSLGYTATGADPGTATTDGAPITVTTDVEGLTTYVVTAENSAGERRTETVVIGIDTTAPTIDLDDHLTQDMIVGRGASVPLSFACHDVHTQVAGCEPVRAGNGFLDTSTVGRHTIDLVAVDTVGNRRVDAFTYEVLSTLEAVSAPVVTGVNRVGSTLTASGATFRPAASAVSYHWYVDQVRVSGGADLPLLPAYRGKQVHVVAVGSRDTFDDGVVGKVAGPVGAGRFAISAPPTISFDPVVGNTLQAAPPTSAPTATAITYQWLRDGTPIGGATEADYTVADDDLGQPLSVEVTIRREGYDDHTQSSADTPRVTGPALGVTRATAVTGKARTGEVLTAVAPQLSGVPDSVSYQWLRDGSTITGATGTTYRLLPGDVGRRISVRATASVANRADTVSESSALTVERTTPQMKATGISRRAGTVKLSVSVSAPGVRPTGRLVVRRGAKTVATVAVVPGRTSVVTLKRQPRRAVAYTVVYSGDAVTAPRKVRTARIRVR